MTEADQESKSLPQPAPPAERDAPDSAKRRELIQIPTGDEESPPGLEFEPARSLAHRRQQAEMQQQIAAQEARKLKARSERHHSVWFGLGMFGLIGWSVVIPALAGVALGLWIDAQWPSRFSWTLMLLILGILFGCLNAWRWVQKEGRIDQ